MTTPTVASVTPAASAAPADDFDAVFAELTKAEDASGKPDQPGVNPAAPQPAVAAAEPPAATEPAAAAEPVVEPATEPAAVVAAEPVTEPVTEPTTQSPELVAALARVAELEAAAKKPVAAAPTEPVREEIDPPAAAAAEPPPIKWYEAPTN